MLIESLSTILPLCLFAFSSTMTPGPNNFLLMNAGLNHGFKKSMPMFLGITLGFPLMILVVALGLGAIFIKYLWLKTILKLAAVLYIIHVVWQILFRAKRDEQNSNVQPFSFIKAMSFQWINPKAWIMAIGSISIFTISHQYFINALSISGLFLIMCVPSSTTWLAFGAVLEKMVRNKKRLQQINIVLSICLMLSIAMIIFD